MDFKEELFLDLLEKLVLEKGPSLGETPRLKIIESFLGENGIFFKKDNASNIIIPFNSDPDTNPVIFDAHTDVAGKGFSKKFKIDDDFITGQGCADDLAAVVMLTLLAKELVKKNLKKPLIILFSTGEEGKGNLFGIKEFTKNFSKKPEIFVSFDLSFNTISYEGLGSKRFSIKIKTPGGHSFEDYGTPNSIELMSSLIENIRKSVHVMKDPLVTFNAGFIKGGGAINQIAEDCLCEIELRSVCQESLKSVEQKLDDEIKKISETDILIEKSDIGSRPGSGGVDRERIVSVVAPLFKDIGITPEEKTMSTNINATLAEDWPSFCTGICSCGKFHTEEEFIERKSLYKGWNLLVGMVKEFGII